MHISPLVSGTETPKNKNFSKTSSLHSLMLATALAISGCVSLPQSTENIRGETYSESELENPSFIALLGICAEIQAEINLDTDNQFTLEYIWQTIKSELEKTTDIKHISVGIVTPQKTERGYAYIDISVTDQKGATWHNALYAKNKTGAEEEIQSLRDNYMLYLKEKLEYIQSISQRIDIKMIIDMFETEKLGFEKHKIRYEVMPDGNSWMIVLHYTDGDEFGLFCLAGDPRSETSYFGE